ncbi:MAG: uroporphyrinogen-III C-methyltransferase [Acidobacteriota bacterium]|nr:uroporphyrinogen-III C-methyltransferase [Acidobacteriota bacterium]
MQTGKVYLVGAGPGDPGLLTIKARDLLELADCVVYDALVNPEILRFAKPNAELIGVGKRCGQFSWSQREINCLLIEKAHKHSVVVRLKGGDPFIFGRGGEEALALADAQIDWEIVPGVTAGSSVAAYAGIPVTHRAYSSSVTFVTGHEDLAKTESTLRWQHLAKGVDTLVLFMGLSKLGEIAEQLVANGRAADTPVAVISCGTLARQQTVVGTLNSIADIAQHQPIKAPALIVIGEVVRLREQLQWFEGIADCGLRIADSALPHSFAEPLRLARRSAA